MIAPRAPPTAARTPKPWGPALPIHVASPRKPCGPAELIHAAALKYSAAPAGRPTAAPRITPPHSSPRDVSRHWYRPGSRGVRLISSGPIPAARSDPIAASASSADLTAATVTTVS